MKTIAKILNILMALLLIPTLLAGCNMVGFMAQAVSPPELVEAKYELPDKPTLIVIDDLDGLVNNESLLRAIANSTVAALEAEKVVTVGFVGQDELAGYREHLGDAYKQTSLAALGSHLGAKQVIHAEVTGYQMDLGGSVVRPGIAMNVKVFDLDQLTRVFPPDKDPKTGVDTGITTYPLAVKMPARDLSGQGAARSIVARELASLAGRDLGRLFFDWRKPEPGSNLDNR